MRTTRLVDITGAAVPPPSDGSKINLGKPKKITTATIADWRDLRNETIGGSDAPAILGLSPYMSAYELYALKAGLVEQGSEESEVLEWGIRLEEPIVEAYMDKTNRTITRHGIHVFRSLDYPISVSLDGEIAPIDDRGPGVLEIKTTTAFSEKELQEELPIHYQIQVQHAMAVMGYKWGSIAIFMMLPRKLRYIDVERNDDFIDMLLHKEMEFVEKITSNDPPKPDGSDSAAEAIKKLFPRDTGKSVVLPEAAAEWDRTITESKAAIKKLTTAQLEAENNLKAAIGDFSFGILPDGSRYSWRLQHRDGYYVKESEFRVLRRLK